MPDLTDAVKTYCVEPSFSPLTTIFFTFIVFPLPFNCNFVVATYLWNNK